MKGLEFEWEKLKKKLNLKFDKIQNGTGKAQTILKSLFVKMYANRCC